MIFSPPFGVSFDVDIVGISVSVDVTTGFGVFAIEICQFHSKIQLKNSNPIHLDTYKKRFSVYDSVQSFPLYLMVNSLTHSGSDLMSIFDQFGQIT